MAERLAAALTPWSKVGILEASHFDADTVYAAIDRHRLDDLDPHIYRTRDAGKTWTSIARGIPAGSFVNVVREDPERRGLLYAGTETGVFVSFNDGEDWQALQGNLPNCSVRDISVRRGDLVLGTHGRPFWVLDDLSPLRQLNARTAAAKAWLFAPRDAVRLNPAGFQELPSPGTSPRPRIRRGRRLDYLLQATSTAPVVIEILDASGAVVRRYASNDAKEPPDLQALRVTEDWLPEAEPPSAAAGLHRVVWDLHYAPAAGLSRSRRPATGVWAPPGPYTARLTAAGQTLTQALVVRKDPRVAASAEDLVRQFELARRVEADRVRAGTALASATSLRKQAAALAGRASGDAAAALAEFGKQVDAAAGPPTSPEEFYDVSQAPPPSLLRLVVSLARLQGSIESADVAPTPDAVAGLAQRQEALEQGLARWNRVVTTDLPRVNAALGAAGLPA